MAKTVKPKMYDVLITRGCLVPGPDGGMIQAGPNVKKDEKTGRKKFGEPARVSVTRRVGNQIVQSDRGYWADGEPEREATTDEPTETGAQAPARGRGGSRGAK